MRGSLSVQSSRSGRHHAYSVPDTSSLQEPVVYNGKMPASEDTAPVDILLNVSTETVHALTVHQNKMLFQCPLGLMKEIVWDHSEKSVHFVLDDGSTSPTFIFPVLTDLETHLTAILALPDLENPPEQAYIGVLIGQNLPSPIQQRRASFGFTQPAMVPMSKRKELLKREQPVQNATSRERLGLEFIRSGFLCFTCSINGDLRGLTLGVAHLRVYPSPDSHDRSACLFSYSYEHLESCDVSGTRLELRFRSTHQLAKQPSCLVFQSLESQYIREAVWYLKNGSYMDASIRELLASPRSNSTRPIPHTGSSRRGNMLMFFTDTDSLKQRIEACCRVIGCESLVESSECIESRMDEASALNDMVYIHSGELRHINPSTSRVITSGLCEFHTSCLSSPADALTRHKSRDKPPLPAKSMQPLVSLLQSKHYAKMFKLQGQLLKRQNGRTFHLRKTWHPKLVALFETPVGGFLCYYDKITHCPGLTETPKERRVIDLSSVMCIRPVSNSSPVSRSSSPTMHAFDVVTLYRTWTFAALEPEQYEIWLHVLTECVEKHATIAPDRVLRFPVKLAMTAQTSPSEATSLEISSHGVLFCTGHDSDVVLSSWYYTDLEKWSVVYQQGYTCCLLKCKCSAPASPGSPRTITGDTITQDFLFRTAEASTICLAIEFYVGKCMAKLEVLAGQYLEETKTQKAKTNEKQLRLVQEHPIETVILAPVKSPEKPTVDEAPKVQGRAELTDRMPVLDELLIDLEDAPQKEYQVQGNRISEIEGMTAVETPQIVRESNGEVKAAPLLLDLDQDFVNIEEIIELVTIDLGQPGSDSVDGTAKGTDLSSSPAIQEAAGTELKNQQLQYLLRLLSPPPLLLLEYQSSWLDDQHEVNEVEHVPEDNRNSECEVSDRSDAFNSCASEVELPPHLIDEYDPLELFEDAMDRIDSRAVPQVDDKLQP
ncbi:hypothetical protein P3T76_006464 [Phytophthora citrophthora]|uniref:PH domain-containing protein n=1 Tax=Phytophthora citrophthora TaxID=4793 RepID=A0AAD9LNU3_9STRA|nr:hypothetical protein P3T76_006464 [Phytophthora citrophthora]